MASLKITHTKTAISNRRFQCDAISELRQKKADWNTSYPIKLQGLKLGKVQGLQSFFSANSVFLWLKSYLS
jgi:hypothetical protein